MTKPTRLLHYVAPCSLLCYTYPALRDGAVTKLSSELLNYFESFYEFNKEATAEDSLPWLNEFQEFYKKLQSCAQCGEFPCARAREFFSSINSVIASDWKNGSGKIREIGIERYFMERKSLSHYINYKRKDV